MRYPRGMDANPKADPYVVALEFFREQVLPILGVEEAEIWWTIFLAGPSLGEKAMREANEEALEGVRLLGFPEALALVERAARLPYDPRVSFRVVALLKGGGGIVVDLGKDGQGVVAQGNLEA